MKVKIIRLDNIVIEYLVDKVEIRRNTVDGWILLSGEYIKLADIATIKIEPEEEAELGIE